MTPEVAQRFIDILSSRKYQYCKGILYEAIDGDEYHCAMGAYLNELYGLPAYRLGVNHVEELGLSIQERQTIISLNNYGVPYLPFEEKIKPGSPTGSYQHVIDYLKTFIPEEEQVKSEIVKEDRVLELA
jgi:hypothetical protein